LTGRWIEYVGIFAVSVVLCLLLTPLLSRLGRRLHLLDRPGHHKSHKQPVPYLGGLAIVTSFTLAIFFAAITNPPVSGRDELFYVLAAAMVLAGVGLLDDLSNLPVWPRIVLELAAGLLLWQLGAGVSLIGINALDLMLTLLWVVVVTNAFNLLDNMDGLSAGIAAICCIAIFALAVSSDQFLVAGMAAGLAGCALGFLSENFHPADVFMGDSGALYLGFLVAYLGIKLDVPGDGVETFLVPLLVCSVALFDTSLVVISRLLGKRNPFQGGRDHVSHRLVLLSLPVPAAVAWMYCATAVTGALAFLVSRVDRASSWFLGILVLVIMAVGGRLLLEISVYPDEQDRSSTELKPD